LSWFLPKIGGIILVDIVDAMVGSIAKFGEEIQAFT
jgi:hypothetical protein